MTSARRTLLRQIMITAWGFFRSAAERGEPYDRFGDALTSAWRFVRSHQDFINDMAGATHIRLSPSLIHSPIEERLGAASVADFNAAYLTARLGG